MSALTVYKLGTVPYKKALDLQLRLVEMRKGGEIGDTLLLLEHPHVYTLGVRAKPEAAPGIVQVNTHVDLIAWHAGRGFAGEQSVLGAAVRHLAAKREGRADAAEPTGWLSHHAVHDEAAWAFLERLFETARGSAGVRWLGADELFHSS